MKKLFAILTCLVSFGAFAQTQVPSPPAVVIQKVGGTEVMIKYAQPAVKGRLVLEQKRRKHWFLMAKFGERGPMNPPPLNSQTM